MKNSPIPVWAVTGYLGSGKTTLLNRWLRHAGLAHAVLIINEIGEVGLDDHILSRSADSASTLLANQCICCNGLPGLEGTLTELWWARLRRERPHFDTVVIETTGLAAPGPISQLFELVPLLRERYVLHAVVTTVSATAGCEGIEAQTQAREQLQAADTVVFTKVDRAEPAAIASLSTLIQAYAPQARVLQSAMASLDWNDMAAATPGRSLGNRLSAAVPRGAGFAAVRLGGRSGYAPIGESVHGVQSRFIPLPQPMALDAWKAWLGSRLGAHLLRLKGVVLLDEGLPLLVQWSQGDEYPLLQPFEGSCPSPGLTEIHSQ